jgi:hypothetical protein
MLYSHNNQYPDQLPNRIRLSSGLTKTDSSTFTAEEIADAGYVLADTSPSYDVTTQKVIWNSGSWEVVSLTDEEIADNTKSLWDEIRENRDTKIMEAEWRVMRNLSETRIGITTTTDNISDLDTYIQALRDIGEQTDPRNITWPILSDGSPQPSP